MPNPRQRILQLDLARIVFCLPIFIFHYLSSHARLQFGSDQIWREHFLYSLGKLSITAFFIVSGWVLTLRYGHTMTSKRGIIDYFKRRCLRIWPLYFSVLLMAWLLGDVPGGKLLATVFFMNNFVMPLGAFGSSWTLAVEEQFYLFLPLLLLFNRLFVVVFAAVAVLVIVAPHPFQNRYHTYYYLLPLLVGIAIAEIQLLGPQYLKRLFVLLLSAAMICVALKVEWTYQMLSLFGATSLLGFYLLPRSWFTPFQRVLLIGSLATYPFYLLHEFMIRWALSTTTNVWLAGTAALTATAVCSLILSKAVSSVLRIRQQTNDGL